LVIEFGRPKDAERCATLVFDPGLRKAIPLARRSPQTLANGSDLRADDWAMPRRYTFHPEAAGAGRRPIAGGTDDMSEQREEMCDVEVVLKEPFAERAGTIDDLRRHGLRVTDVDRDDGVVEGTIPAAGVAALQKLESVAYVRIVFTYLAEH
jgi:hypothetical protein